MSNDQQVANLNRRKELIDFTDWLLLYTGHEMGDLPARIVDKYLESINLQNDSNSQTDTNNEVQQESCPECGSHNFFHYEWFPFDKRKKECEDCGCEWT